MADAALLLSFIWFALACVALVLSGSLVIDALAKIARFLRLSEFVVAFVIMAVATSIPELFIGISAAMAGATGLALGTVIGSNIADLTLVIGIAILLGRGISVRSREIKKDALIMVGVVILPLIMMALDGSISRLEGGLLVSVFLGYQYYMYAHRREAGQRKMGDGVSRLEAVATPILFLLGVILLFASAHYVVQHGVAIADGLGVPRILVGVILVALGTSLPELAFETKAAMGGHGDMALGDAIGSVITNSTLVLGVTALISPITADPLLFFTAAAFMVAITLLFSAFVETADRLSWRVGLALIFLYIFFIIVEVYIKNIQALPT
jgi:cation:H+ antiporter